MKNRIYYFTGTGNSLKIAKELAKGIGDTELVRITRKLEVDNSPIGYERVGIVTPVYMGGLPKMVKEFLEKLNVSSNAYIFSVATCGGMAGAIHHMISEILLKKNLKLSSSFTFHLPANNQTRYAPASLKEQERLFISSESNTINVIDIISNYSLVQYTKSPFISVLAKVSTRLLSPRDSDVNFYAEYTCIGCGICKKVCPAQNIIIENKKPKWQHNCERCTACMQLCPKQAIQFKNASKKWGRYHHPDITVHELEIEV